MQQLLDFLLLVGLVRAFELVEHIQMLLGGQQVEKHIMLRTHTHGLSGTIHVVEQINAKEARITLRLVQQASQHRDCGRFASTIVAKQAEDLVSIHLDIETVYGFKPVLILFVQVGHFQELVIKFVLVNLRC